jgi:Flp pilus assembly pilin Flp
MTAGSRQSFFALFHRDPRGTAAVEFALIAPVLFLLILGITQFGITLNDYEMLTGGTEAAARQLDAIQQYHNRFVQRGIQPHASKHHIHTKGEWDCVHRRQCVPDRADQRARTARHDNDVISMQPDGLWLQLCTGLHPQRAVYGDR